MSSQSQEKTPLDDLWPSKGRYCWSGTRIVELKEKTAVGRLRELEKHLQGIVPGDRCLIELVRGFDAEARAAINRWMDPRGQSLIPANVFQTPKLPPGLPGAEFSHALPTQVSDKLKRIVDCLRIKGLAVDGMDVLSNEPEISCYAYLSKYEQVRAGGDGRPVSDAAIAGHYAVLIEKRLKSEDLCEFILYERLESETLRLELRRTGGTLLLRIHLSLVVYGSIEAVAYGPSSGLLFCCDGRRLATPSMQFLFAYGLAVDADETSKGVRAALFSPGFEACDVLLPKAPNGRGRLVETLLDSGEARMRQDPSLQRLQKRREGEGWHLCRNRFEGRLPAPRKLLTSDWKRDALSPVQLLAEKRYKELRPRGWKVSDALSPSRFREWLCAKATEVLSQWIRTAKTGRGAYPHNLVPLVPECDSDLYRRVGEKSFDTICETISSELHMRANEATQCVFGDQAVYFEGLDFSFLGLEDADPVAPAALFRTPLKDEAEPEDGDESEDGPEAEPEDGDESEDGPGDGPGVARASPRTPDAARLLDELARSVLAMAEAVKVFRNSSATT